MSLNTVGTRAPRGGGSFSHGLDPLRVASLVFKAYLTYCVGNALCWMAAVIIHSALVGGALLLFLLACRSGNHISGLSVLQQLPAVILAGYRAAIQIVANSGAVWIADETKQDGHPPQTVNVLTIGAWVDDDSGAAMTESARGGVSNEDWDA